MCIVLCNSRIDLHYKGFFVFFFLPYDEMKFFTFG